MTLILIARNLYHDHIANISDYLFEDTKGKGGFGPVQQEQWKKLNDLMANLIEGEYVIAVLPQKEGGLNIFFTMG